MASDGRTGVGLCWPVAGVGRGRNGLVCRVDRRRYCDPGGLPVYHRILPEVTTLILTRQDVMTAIRIRKLLFQSNSTGVTLEESAAYLAKALQLKNRYRYGKSMRV